MARRFLVTPIGPEERGYGRMLRARLALAATYGKPSPSESDLRRQAEGMSLLIDELIRRGRVDDGSDPADALDEMTAEEFGAALAALFADVDDAVDPPSAGGSPSGRRATPAKRRGGS